MTENRPQEPAAGDDPGEERRPAGPTPGEVTAEPFDAERDRGRTIDMPPPGEKARGSPGLGALCHVLGLADLTVPVLLLGLLAPLLLWLAMKDRDPVVDHHGKEAINLQLNLLFWFVVLFLPSLCCLGLPLLLLMLGEVVLVVLAAVAAVQGQEYRYPFLYRVLK
jgi:hypothetical protein